MFLFGLGCSAEMARGGHQWGWCDFSGSEEGMVYLLVHEQAAITWLQLGQC